MTNTIEALNQLTASVNALNASVLGETKVFKDLHQNLFSFRPLTNSIGNLIGRLSNLINPIERFTEAVEKSDDVQRKSLAINSNLAKIYEQNSASLNQLRGSFTDNIDEFVMAFSEGIRVNSRSLNVLRDRMQETGQSTAKLNTITKTLITATAGNEDAISRLADTNVKIARESLISNEKLIDALQRNEEKIDIAALVGLGEGQVDELSKITALMSERGISDKLQQQVVDLLFSTDSNIMALRASFGVGMDANEKIINGQMDVKDVLNIIARNAEKTFVSQDKLNRTSLALQGTQGGELLQAAILTNRLLEQSAKGKEILSKEDAYYAQMKTFTEEQKNFAEQQTAKHYELMKEVPAILDVIRTTVLTYLGGKFLLGAVDGLSNAFNSFKITRAVDFKANKQGLSPDQQSKVLVDALKNNNLINAKTGEAGFGVATGVKGADLLKSITNAFTSIKSGLTSGLTKILGGPITASISGLFGMIGTGISRVISIAFGPVGIAIGAVVAGFTLLADWLGWFKDNRTPAEKAFDDLIQSVNDTSEAINDNVSKIGKSSTAAADSFKFVTYEAFQQAKNAKLTTPQNVTVTPNIVVPPTNNQNTSPTGVTPNTVPQNVTPQAQPGVTPTIQPPTKDNNSVGQQILTVAAPLLSYFEQAKRMPSEQMQKIAFGKVLPTTEEINNTAKGGNIDLNIRNELKQIKDNMLEEQQVMAWASKVKGKGPGGMTVPKTDFYTGQSNRTEQGWEDKLSSGRTRSQIMDDIIKKNREAEELYKDPEEGMTNRKLARQRYDNKLKYDSAITSLELSPDEIKKNFPEMNTQEHLKKLADEQKKFNAQFDNQSQLRNDVANMLASQQAPATSQVKPPEPQNIQVTPQVKPPEPQKVQVTPQIQIPKQAAAPSGLNVGDINLKEQIGSASKVLTDQLVEAANLLRSAPGASDTLGIVDKLEQIRNLTSGVNKLDNVQLEQRHLQITKIFEDVNTKIEELRESGEVTPEILQKIQDKGLKVIPPKEEKPPEQRRSLESVLLGYLSKAANQKTSNEDNKAIQDLALRVSELKDSIAMSKETGRAEYVGRGGRR